jgi:hypothetical protein
MRQGYGPTLLGSSQFPLTGPGSGLLPDEVPIIARRGELVVPPERVVREEKSAREQRPITVVVNVTAADASSFRASQGQIAADMARGIDRASRNR